MPYILLHRVVRVYGLIAVLRLRAVTCVRAWSFICCLTKPDCLLASSLTCDTCSVYLSSAFTSSSFSIVNNFPSPSSLPSLIDFLLSLHLPSPFFLLYFLLSLHRLFVFFPSSFSFLPLPLSRSPLRPPPFILVSFLPPHLSSLPSNLSIHSSFPLFSTLFNFYPTLPLSPRRPSPFILVSSIPSHLSSLSSLLSIHSFFPLFSTFLLFYPTLLLSPLHLPPLILLSSLPPFHPSILLPLSDNSPNFTSLCP